MGRQRIYPDDRARRQAQTARRALARQAHNVRFTGVDGEGQGDGADHRYVLLGCGSEQIENPEGLGFSEVMTFLYECFLQDPLSVYAGFFLSYDFAQWLKGLPENRAYMLLHDAGIARRARTKSGGNLTPFPVEFDGWQFDMLAMKRFKVRPDDNKAQWLYVNDAGPFFQTSFLNAINPVRWAEPIVSEAEYETIAQGKSDRSQATLGPSMRKYNGLENEIFSRLMNETNKGFNHAGIKLNRNQWFGPGQAAQAWLRHVKCPTREEHLSAGLGPYLDLGRMTYFGGWFEIFAHGHIPGRTYEYDINSAYPFIASRLPCFLHGQWNHNSSLGGDGYTIVRASVTGSDHHIGSMLHRLPDGSIRRPAHTAGYYWLHEIEAAKRAGIIDAVDIVDSWTYTPCPCRPPLRGLIGLYDERLRIGKDTVLGKGNKLIYNSVYGKFAQSVGNPKYGNALYASLITAGCRTMILEAIASHPRRSNAVVMVATDGIYFTEPHPGLTISERIGDWDVQETQNLTLFKPGVYWTDDARARLADGNSPHFKSRGINAAQFSSKLTEIDAHYRDWPESYPQERDPMGTRTGWHPRVTFNTSFAMTTPRQALEWGKWDRCGALGHSEPHPSGCQGCNGAHLVQDADPIGKRHSGWYEPERGIYWSTPYPDGGWQEESTPYDKRFGQPDPDEYGITPDGTVLEGFSWLLHEK